MLTNSNTTDIIEYTATKQLKNENLKDDDTRKLSVSGVDAVQHINRTPTQKDNLIQTETNRMIPIHDSVNKTRHAWNLKIT